MASTKKSYSELIALATYDERLEYLKTNKDNPGNKDRKIMNKFYKSRMWEITREKVSVRDLGNDLGILNLPIEGRLEVHHINPITIDDVLMNAECLYDMENLISSSADTHNKIHYREKRVEEPIERKPNDTKLW